MKKSKQTAHFGHEDLPKWGSSLRLVRPLATQTQQDWTESTRHLNMDLLMEHRKELAHKNAAAQLKRVGYGNYRS